MVGWSCGVGGDAGVIWRWCKQQKYQQQKQRLMMVVTVSESKMSPGDEVRAETWELEQCRW